MGNIDIKKELEKINHPNIDDVICSLEEQIDKLKATNKRLRKELKKANVYTDELQLELLQYEEDQSFLIEEPH